MFHVNEENAIVLASESTRRIDILRTLGISFSIIPPDIDERRMASESPREYAMRIAYEKARKVGNLFPEKWVIGADTVVIHKGRVLGKPRNEREARAMLGQLRGKWHKVITAFCILNISKEIIYRDAIETRVCLKDLTDDEIDKYIKTSEPFDKAGSYAVQGKGGFMVKEIKGSYSNVVGLPICEVTEILLSLGILS